MFTGIINHIGTIVKSEKSGDLTLCIASDFPADSFRIGESIACNGACLTVIACHPRESGNDNYGGIFTVQLSAETLGRTAPRWNVGDRLHLERALKMGDALDGHMVTGHIDGLAKILEITPVGDSHQLCLETPPALARFIAEKGAVTLDGISLTINQVEGNRFFVNIIPHTWQVTTLNQRKTGDSLNLEVDMIARYVARLLSKN